jgi:hypothetical protein
MDMSDEDEDHVAARATYCFGSAQAPTCLVRELHKMPTARQEAATKDVLGIPHSAVIGPELIGELWEHINNLEEKAAWDLAVQMDKEYTMSPKRAMSFLRSVEGKPKQAAKRMARHFQVKSDLFGSDKLVKDIELADFDEYDMEALYSGGFQVLPSKDRAGRPILFGRYTLMKYQEVKNMVSTGTRNNGNADHSSFPSLMRMDGSSSNSLSIISPPCVRCASCGTCGTRW